MELTVLLSIIGILLTIIGIIITVVMGRQPIHLGKQLQTSKLEKKSASQSQETAVANPEYRTQPYPSDIISDIDQLPLAQQIQASSNYVGLKVNWRTVLQSVTPNEQNRARLMMFDRGNYPWIGCEIDFSEHPEAKIAKKGHGIWVKGEIVEVRWGVIELVKADVTFD